MQNHPKSIPNRMKTLKKRQRILQASRVSVFPLSCKDTLHTGCLRSCGVKTEAAVGLHSQRWEGPPAGLKIGQQSFMLLTIKTSGNKTRQCNGTHTVDMLEKGHQQPGGLVEFHGGLINWRHVSVVSVEFRNKEVFFFFFLLIKTESDKEQESQNPQPPHAPAFHSDCVAISQLIYTIWLWI